MTANVRETNLFGAIRANSCAIMPPVDAWRELGGRGVIAAWRLATHGMADEVHLLVPSKAI